MTFYKFYLQRQKIVAQYLGNNHLATPKVHSAKAAQILSLLCHFFLLFLIGSIVEEPTFAHIYKIWKSKNSTQTTVRRTITQD
jgi:hypothetical protein